MKCPRCSGSGIVEAWRSRDNGLCYRCKGTGKVDDPRMLAVFGAKVMAAIEASQPRQADGRPAGLRIIRYSRDWYLWKAATDPAPDWRERWAREAERMRLEAIRQSQIQEGELIPYWPEAEEIQSERANSSQER